MHKHASRERPLFGITCTSGRSGPLARDLSAGIATPRLSPSEIDHGSSRSQRAARSRRLRTLGITKHRRHWRRASHLCGYLRCGAQTVTGHDTNRVVFGCRRPWQRGWLRRSLMRAARSRPCSCLALIRNGRCNRPARQQPSRPLVSSAPATMGATASQTSHAVLSRRPEPADGVTLSDGEAREERAPSRRSARPAENGAMVRAMRRSG
jgi:hypothetical protein